MPSDGDAPLPAVSKGAVLSAAASTGFWMGVLALLLRQYAQVGRLFMNTSPCAHTHVHTTSPPPTSVLNPIALRGVFLWCDRRHTRPLRSAPI
jgi:hypothetical protein